MRLQQRSLGDCAKEMQLELCAKHGGPIQPHRRKFLKGAAYTLATLLSEGHGYGASNYDWVQSNPNDIRFLDVTDESGISFVHERAASPEKLLVEIMGAGCAWLDHDQNGFLDALFVNSGRTPRFAPAKMPQPALYRNNGDGTFTDITRQAGLTLRDGFYIGVAVGDFNNDGYPDIYVTGYNRSILFRNNGDGTFTDITDRAGVANSGAWATAAGWFDFDHDGHLDLLVTNYVTYDWNHDPYCGRKDPGYRYYCDPFHFRGSNLKLYHNNGDGTFSDWTLQSGLGMAVGKSLGVVLADFNGDGWDDILIANDGMPAFLFLNQKNGTFRDVTVESGAGFGANGEIESGMGIDAADVTGDGKMDFFVCHMDAQLNRLYQNNGSANFTDVTLSSGLGRTSANKTGFGTRICDWDNDGNRDILIVNGSMLDNIELYHPNSRFAEQKTLYRNTGHGKFVVATKTQGPDFNARCVGRGLAVGDYDNDGALDFLQSNNGGRGQLFRNNGGNGNHWLGIRLIGTISNRDAVGAQVQIWAGSFTSVDQVKGGMSYCSAQDLRLHFGLGAHAQIDKLAIRWPSGHKQLFHTLKVDQYLTIEEGKGILPYQFPKCRRRR